MSSTTPVAAPAAHRPAQSRLGRSERHAKYVFLMPAVIYLLLLGIFPLLFSLYLVFASWQPASKDITWVGLDNIRRLIDDPRFWNAFRLTITYVAIAAAVELVLGFIIALALQSVTRGKSGLRLLFALPMLLPPIAIAFTWKMLFDFNRGPLNYFLTSIGVDAVEWVGSRHMALASLILVDVWQWTPFIILATLAALESQSADLYEAAVVDGASFWNVLRDLTLPLIKPYLVAIVLIRSIDAFKIFDIIFVLTGGGPGTSTELLSFYAYVAGFRPFNMGFAATIAWSMVIIMTIIFLIYLRVFRRLEED